MRSLKGSKPQEGRAAKPRFNPGCHREPSSQSTIPAYSMRHLKGWAQLHWMGKLHKNKQVTEHGNITQRARFLSTCTACHEESSHSAETSVQRHPAGGASRQGRHRGKHSSAGPHRRHALAPPAGDLCCTLREFIPTITGFLGLVVGDERQQLADTYQGMCCSAGCTPWHCRHPQRWEGITSFMVFHLVEKA
jgi:hypothetical protein